MKLTEAQLKKIISDVLKEQSWNNEDFLSSRSSSEELLEQVVNWMTEIDSMYENIHEYIYAKKVVHFDTKLRQAGSVLQKARTVLENLQYQVQEHIDEGDNL